LERKLLVNRQCLLLLQGVGSIMRQAITASIASLKKHLRLLKYGLSGHINTAPIIPKSAQGII
jgi:hypothetical protein